MSYMFNGSKLRHALFVPTRFEHKELSTGSNACESTGADVKFASALPCHRPPDMAVRHLKGFPWPFAVAHGYSHVRMIECGWSSRNGLWPAPAGFWGMDGSKPYPTMHHNAIHHVLTMAHVVCCTFPNCPTDRSQVCTGDLPRFVFFLGPKGISSQVVPWLMHISWRIRQGIPVFFLCCRHCNIQWLVKGWNSSHLEDHSAW